MTKTLYEKLHYAAIANQDVSLILDSKLYKEHGRDSWLGSMMFYAIANNRPLSKFISSTPNYKFQQLN